MARGDLPTLVVGAWFGLCALVGIVWLSVLVWAVISLVGWVTSK